MSITEVIEKLEVEIRETIKWEKYAMSEEEREFLMGQEVAYKDALRMVREIEK